AITGTNGKSTTTALIGWVLKQAGLTVHVGGNIGIGVLDLPPPTPGAAYVIEASSYQLDLTTTFAPDVAILINISPDHLDRHGGMEGYVAAKARLFAAQPADAVALVGVDDDWSQTIAARLEGLGCEPVRISAQYPTRGLYALDGKLWDCAGGTPVEVCDLSRARSLPGRHNAQNAAFAWAAARALGVSHDAAVEGLMTFPGLAHRMEEVARLGRVRFINDSKATNADAARQALSSYERSFWIAGGRAKAGGIDDLEDLFPRVVEAFLIGEAAGPFAARLGDTPHRISGDMASAVKAAAGTAAATGREEVVLLSPAAASFDQYPDFEARGEAFRAAVLDLGAVPASAA
ncbi:MAG: UDP-N-acetylmuramoyl-L-alanine--D-glutamate ligase, partial [Brevundimonas sp.]|nr:UDP-N-acetylmuramoyl-L-alanine--D-glutamate ligase [Brevundimonas sp.]